MGKDKGRYEVRQTDDLADKVPIPTTHTVTVRDKETGREEKGSGTSVKGAEKSAWGKMTGKK